MDIKNKTVKRIFLFFFFYLPFQYMIVGVVGVMYSEPWPAFVLPGFKSVYAAQDHVEITEPMFFVQPVNKNEAPKAVEPSELFKGMPTSQLQGFIKSNFSTQTELSAEANNWLRKQVARLYPEKKFTGLKIEWVPVVYYSQDNTVQTTAKESTKSISIPFADQ